MNFVYNTNNKPVSFHIDFATKFPTKVRLIAKDINPNNKYTYYTNRYKTINGRGKLILNMPVSPEDLLISIYDDKKGNTDNGFIIEPVVTVHPLPTQLQFIDYFDPNINSFIAFAEEFCHHAGNIAPGTIIQSKDHKFVIQYVDELKNKDGSISKTPARIGAKTGNMQVNRKSFLQYTVPMRMAIMLHEFSHFWINKTKEDETEADLNALLIYLSLGYPRIEAYNGFLSVFHSTPNLQNKERYTIIKDFIENFDKGKYQIVKPSQKALINKRRKEEMYLQNPFFQGMA